MQLPQVDCGDQTELLSTPSLQIEGCKTYNVIMSVDDTSQGLQTFNGLNAFKAQGKSSWGLQEEISVFLNKNIQ